MSASPELLSHLGSRCNFYIQLRLREPKGARRWFCHTTKAGGVRVFLSSLIDILLPPILSATTDGTRPFLTHSKVLLQFVFGMKSTVPFYTFASNHCIVAFPMCEITLSTLVVPPLLFIGAS